MTKRTRRPASSVAVPQDAMEADQFIQRIGTAQREAALIQAALEETVTAAKQRAEAQAAVLAETVEQLTQGLQVWAEANRVKLTRDGASKTVKMPSGEICWRTRPLSIGLANVPAVVERLRSNPHYAEFVRTKHEVDKDALLRKPDLARTIPGVTLKGGNEEFIVSPLGMELAASTEGRAAA